MNRPNKIAYLDKKVTGAVKVITDTIATLEQTTSEYEAEKVAINKEIAELNNTGDYVDTKIKENNKLLANFKKLLA
jgi:cell division protein FtsB